MSENCSHACSGCASNCSERRQRKDFLAEPNSASRIGKVIGVASGKGGVGKSLVASLLAVLAQRAGKQAAILDADITGPSIPGMFGLRGAHAAGEESLVPLRTAGGIKIISVNLFLNSDSDPVIWRGPILAGVTRQFWTDVQWGDVDCMFVDMPPGTGDVPLTVFQSLPLDGVVMVATPQELVGTIVEKAVRMAQMMDVPLLGLVENMAYFLCPTCSERHRIFGPSHLDELAARFHIPATAQIPLDPALAALCDRGEIGSFEGRWLDAVAKVVMQ